MIAPRRPSPDDPQRRRPLPLRLRGDLVAQQQFYRGRPHWLVKDPVALKYYRFEPEEFALLKMLDGRTSLGQLEERFAGRLSREDIPKFLSQMLQLSVVTSDLPASAAAAEAQAHVRRPRRWGLTSLLFLRIPLGDPHRLLTWLVGRVGWIFSLPAVLAGLALAISALLLVLVQFEVFLRHLPSFGQFFGPGNLYLLGVSLIIVKLVHELGHGLSCRRFGGECHEMGVLMLLFTPCLYCDVSDGWMLPSKWKRAAIGAAGMYCELLLAACATYLWWWTQPCVLHYLALNIMFVCSVSTLLVNLNPLLRYDGYYIFADLIEVPNLRQKATAAVGRAVSRVLLGERIETAAQAPDQRGLFLVLYGAAALVYRMMVTLSILVFLYYALEPYGLQSLGQCLAAMLLATQGIALVRLGLRWGQVGRWRQVSKKRLAFSMLVLGSALSAALWLPLPQWISCPFYVQPLGAQAVYVDVGGDLVALHAAPGEYVAAGQPIATLENLDLDLALLELEARAQQLVAHRQQLAERALHDENAALEIQQLERALATTQEQLDERRRDQEQLVLRAPCDGIVLPLPTEPARHGTGELPRWSGSLLELRNLGARVLPGEAVCLVGDPAEVTAVLALDQRDLEFVEAGDSVKLQPASLPGQVHTAPVAHVARRAMQAAPASLSIQAGGTLAMQTTAAGQQQPRAATYQASVPLTEPQQRLVPGTTGHAKVVVGHCPLAAHVYRWAERTLR